jgi:chemotaxis protein methyltransferase CheR
VTALAIPVRQEDRLAERDFHRLSQFIYDYSGIKMPPNKRTMLEGRLRKRMRETGYYRFDDYCHYLFNENGLEIEAVDLIDVVTTNKTDFFREPRHFEFMAKTALPAIAARTGGAVRAWSAASSTGAEAYTMAMVMEDYAERRPSFDYRILATDLSTHCLVAAHRGVFSQAMVEPVPALMRRQFVLTSKDPRRREVRIHPRLRSKIAFGRLNLMDDHYAVDEPMDMIFCRNVLIYFDKPTQAGVLKRLTNCLAVGGYLFIGHSESIQGVDLPVEQVAHTVFQKV